MERYQRREQKLRAEKNRMKKHGQTLAQIYKRATETRVKEADEPPLRDSSCVDTTGPRVNRGFNPDCFAVGQLGIHSQFAFLGRQSSPVYLRRLAVLQNSVTSRVTG